jgi:RHS repeat-associated protein
VDGLLTSVTNRRSQRFAVTYDAVHRPLTRTGTKSTVDSLGYSANWRVMAAWNAISRDSMFFSSAGWLDSVKTRFAGGQWFRTTYRPTSNQQLDSVAIASSSGITFPSPKFVYDPTSTALLKAIAGSDTASFTYDAEFKQISKTLGSALTRTDSFTTLHQIYESTYSLPSADSAFWRAYLSDSLGRLVGVARNDPYGVLIGGEIYRFAITQLTIGYDSLGRLSAQDFGYANSCGSVNPDYGLSCPPSAGSENSYSYDRADNLIGHHLTWPQGNQFDSTTYTVGNRIQTQWTPGLSYVHDLDGNITRKYGASTDIRYAWSASGQLMGDTVASTGATIGYDYNALGQLVRRTKNGAADRYYLWDGMQPVAELDGSASNRIAEYAYLPGGGEQPFAIVLGAKAVSAIRDVELDAMGNAIGVLNSAGGVIERRTYDLWGAISSDSGALGDSAFVGWKGLLWQGDSTRLYYAQNRWYDPNTGRFVSEDPIGIAGGLNAYVFAGDDPVNGSDPSGLHGFCGALMGPCMGGHSVGIDPSGCRGNALCAERGGKFLPGGYLGTLPVYGTVADLGTTATAATGVFDASAAFSGLASAADLAPPLALAEGIIAIGYVAVMPAFPGNGTLRTRAISGALVGNDATVVYSRSEAKQIRDAIRSVTGAPATTSQFNCMADFIHECKDAGDGGSKNDKGDFTWTELLQIARDLFSPEY